MSEIHQKYVDAGEQVYLGMNDSLVAFPGDRRVKLVWYVNADPKIDATVFYWNMRQDSVEKTFIRTHSGVQKDSVIIESLADGTYIFELINKNRYGDRSLTTTVVGRSYGEIYESSLENRSTKYAAFDEDEGVLRIEWNEADANVIAVKLEYTDIHGESRTLMVPNSETSTTIPDFKEGEPVFYVTLYKPEPIAIDVFYAPKVQLVPIKVSLSSTEDVVISGDGTIAISGTLSNTVTVSVDLFQWTAVSDQTWLTIVASGTGFTLKAEPNDRTVSRTASVSVTAGPSPAITLNVTQLPVYADVTSVLKNTQYPFTTGDVIEISNNRLFMAADWLTNAAGGANGNVDTHVNFGGRLGIWGQVGNAIYPLPLVENGKLYQTVELEAGIYRFNVVIFRSGNSIMPPEIYIAANSGNDLPDTNEIEQTALGFISVPNVTVNADIPYFLEFALSAKSDVSLGFVVTTQESGSTQFFVTNVGLWKKL